MVSRKCIARAGPALPPKSRRFFDGYAKDHPVGRQVHRYHCALSHGEKRDGRPVRICAVFAEFSGTDPGVPSGLNPLPEPPARAFGIRKIATVGDLRIGGIGSGRFLRRKAGATREGCDGARDIVCRLRCDHRGCPFFLSIRQGSGASRICAVPGTVSGSSRCPGVGSIPNWRRAKRYSSRNSAFSHTFDHRIWPPVPCVRPPDRPPPSDPTARRRGQSLVAAFPALHDVLAGPIAVEKGEDIGFHIFPQKG